MSEKQKELATKIVAAINKLDDASAEVVVGYAEGAAMMASKLAKADDPAVKPN